MIPTPPFNEQHRIVAKIDELMARCDTLEQLRTEQEQKRLDVHQAVIKQLLNEPESNAWSFIQRHFNELYSVKENVEELRKAILQLAVMGRLVPQDPNDQPASELLKEIEAEKRRLIKEGKIKKQKPLPEITAEEIPYKLPESWEWARLGEISEIIGGAAYKSTAFDKSGINQVIRLGNIRPDFLRVNENPVFIADTLAMETQNYELGTGDILITMTGTRNKRDYLYTLLLRESDFKDKKLFLNQRVGAIRTKILPEFLNMTLKADFLQDLMFSQATGSANQANIGITALREWVIPVPSLSAQYRIVIKVSELMALCDQLETKIGLAVTKRAELLDAVLAQV